MEPIPSQTSHNVSSMLEFDVDLRGTSTDKPKSGGSVVFKLCNLALNRSLSCNKSLDDDEDRLDDREDPPGREILTCVGGEDLFGPPFDLVEEADVEVVVVDI